MSDAPAYLCAAISIEESGWNIAYHIRYPDAQVVFAVWLGSIDTENLCELYASINLFWYEKEYCTVKPGDPVSALGSKL